MNALRVSTHFARFASIALLVAGGNLYAQTSGCGAAEPNNWRRIPFDESQQHDTVTPETRAARDAYWSRVFPVPSGPNYHPMIDVDSIGGASLLGPNVTYPTRFEPNLYMVVAKIVGFDVYEQPDRTIYTEMHLRIDRLLDRKVKAHAPQVGSVVDVGIGGGCIKRIDGTVHEYASSSYQYKMRPGHTYLVELNFPPPRGFYVPQGIIADVTSGVAEPVQRNSVGAAGQGQWKYSGMTVDALIAETQSILWRDN